MLKNKNIRAVILALSIAALIAAGGIGIHQIWAYGQSLRVKLNVFNAILNTIQNVYVEKVEPTDLIDDAIRGMISHLDPHTSYLSPEQYKEWSKSYEGYSGIGIYFDIINKKITIMSVIEGGPSYKVGLMAGDRIIAIDGKSAIGMKRDEVPKKLMGPPGTKVRVTIEREGWEEPKEFVIIRERVNIKSVSHAFMIKPGIGYIKIAQFSTTTGRELEEALNKLERQGMKKLLLDLRGNSGGYLQSAVEVADKFIPGGKLIVYTKGRIPSSYREYFATHKATHPLYPLIVLIDHASASASEIVAGAIQDWDRGLVVGKTSFGKGLVQSQYRFQDGSALLITTAKYYTPTGRLIQREYSKMSREEYYHEAYVDSLREKVKERPIFKTPLGRTVYGGGGITPDIIIESDWKPLSEAMRRLLYAEERFFYTFAEEYVRQHPEIKKDFRKFLKKFTVDDKTFKAFKNKVLSSGFNFSPKDFAENEERIKFYLKRELAYIIWGDDAQFKVAITKDTQLKKALAYFPEAEKLLALTKVKK